MIDGVELFSVPDEHLQLTLREKGLTRIRDALHTLFIKDKRGEALWRKTGVRTPWQDER